ncbi:MAG: DUF3244 domain-containing protein [Dysgonomonas sp.]|nr:DUF3244 domain-containing protein [Dysgonomonas sp.]
MKYLKTLILLFVAFSMSNKMIPANIDGINERMHPIVIIILADDGMEVRSLMEKVRAYQSDTYVEIDVVTSDNLQMNVEDANGLPLYLRQYTVSPGKVRIDINGLPRGEYKLRFETQDGSYIAYAILEIE